MDTARKHYLALHPDKDRAIRNVNRGFEALIKEAAERQKKGEKSLEAIIEDRLRANLDKPISAPIIEQKDEPRVLVTV